MTILYVLMVVFAMVTVYALMQGKAGAGWGKPAAGAGAAVTVVLALAGAIGNLSGCGKGSAEVAVRERTVTETALVYEGFGAAIAQEFAGAKAMLVTVDTTDSEQLEMIRKSLGDGLAGKVEIVKVWTPVPTTAESGEASFDAAKLDAEFAGSGADLLISVIGLPPDFQELQMLRVKPLPRVALLNMAPDMNLRLLLQNNLVQLAAVPNSSYKPAKGALPDASAFFATRYVAITPKSLGGHQAVFH